MVKGNELILDLEKKLNLYSNNINNEVVIFEKAECEEIVNIVFSVFQEKTITDEVEKYNIKYGENLIVEKNIIKYSHPNNFSKIGIKMFEKLYFDDKKTSLANWLEITQLFENYGFWYWLVELSEIEEVREFFLDEITNYIIKNKDLKENWIKTFEEYQTNNPSHHMYVDINKIPKSFNDSFEIYEFFKENKYADFLFHRFDLKIKSTFVWCLLEHEVSRSYYYNEDSYSRINRLLVELEDDYFAIGDILSSESNRFNTYLLSNSKYCHYGFLNIATKDIYLNNLVNENGFDYNKQWLDLLSNQSVNIFLTTLLNNHNKDITQIIFNTTNYLVKNYFKSKNDLTSFALEKFLNKFSSSITKENKLLFNTIVNDLVEIQINLLEQNKNIQVESYFILNWYLKNLDIREKTDDINYNKSKTDITKAIFGNIQKNFNKSIETKYFHVNSSEILKNTNFELFYELSSEELKNSWIELLDLKQLKYDLQNDNGYYGSSLGKFYLEILIVFYSKSYDERLEKIIIEVVLKLGIEEELGIFFSVHESKLYDSFLKILNTFKDKNYQSFINKVFEIKDITNLLQIYNATISNERKEVLKTKIEKFNFYDEEFHNYNDLQNSISYALNNGFHASANSLLNIYDKLIDTDRQELLKREGLKEKIIIENKNPNAIRIDMNSSSILTARIEAFEQLKYKKDLFDIYHEASQSLNKKLEEINSLKLPIFDASKFGNREIKTELDSYRRFIIALVHLDENPLTTYEILKELNQEKPTSFYLSNMLRAYYEAYKNDKNKKEKFEYIVSEYKKLEKQLDNFEKGLLDYQVLLTIYSSINNFKSFVELWNELPKTYHFDIHLATIRCQFLQNNNQSLEALSYLEKLKAHHKLFNQKDLKELNELEVDIKNQITIQVKEKIPVSLVLEKSKSLDKYDAKNYWLQIKDMNDESHAHIFANQENIEEYIKDIMLNIAEELLERKKNLKRINENNKLELEDIINDWVTSLLTHRKLFLGWQIQDQTRGGVSGSGEGIGEKDLVVKNSKNRNLFLFEAFKDKIGEHLNKLDGYNASGCKLILIFVYTNIENFSKYSNDYKDKISKIDYTGFDSMNLPVNIEKVDSPSTIYLYKEIRQKNKEDTTILHYLLDFN